MRKYTLIFGIAFGSFLLASAQNNATSNWKKAFQSEQFQLSGYGQILYSLNSDPGYGFVACSNRDTHQSIDIMRVILTASGSLGKNNQFGYRLMYDFGPNARLQELFGEWKPLTALNLRFGQGKVPFTMENPMSPARIETIYFSRSEMAMSGGTGDVNQYEADGKIAGKAGRDIGLQVYGALFKKNNFHQFDYTLGVYNGTGPNMKDNNDRKDFVGALYYHPVKNLRLGGSVYCGSVFRAINGEPAKNHVRNRWAAGIEYDGKLFYGRSEYMVAKDGDLQRNGFYASAVWKFLPEKWEVLGKYEYYAGFDDSINDYTAGLNYYFAYLCRLQLNYVYSQYRTGEKDHALLAQMQLFF